MRVGKRLVRLQTQKQFMKFGIFAAHVMRIVCCDKFNVQLGGNFFERGTNFNFFVKPVILKFQKKIFPPENVDVFFRKLNGTSKIVLQNRTGNFARHARTERNQPAVIFAQKFFVDTRTIIKTLNRRRRRQLEQISVTVVVFGKQDEMKIFHAVDFFAQVSGLGRDVNFATDNRLDVAFLRRLVKINQPVQGAVIRYRQRFHAETFCRVEQVADSRRAVEQAVFGVNVQMREVRNNLLPKNFGAIISKARSLFNRKNSCRPKLTKKTIIMVPGSKIFSQGDDFMFKRTIVAVITFAALLCFGVSFRVEAAGHYGNGDGNWHERYKVEEPKISVTPVNPTPVNPTPVNPTPVNPTPVNPTQPNGDPFADIYNSNDTWLIQWYLCGSDLESNYGCATNDLQELLKVKLPANISVVIQTGGSKIWQNDTMSNTAIGRYLYDSNGLQLLETLPDAGMGDVNTLTDFVRYGKEKFSVDHRVFVFWDHGGGSVRGLCFDERTSNGLSVNDLTEAFGAVYNPSSENHPF